MESVEQAADYCTSKIDTSAPFYIGVAKAFFKPNGEVDFKEVWKNRERRRHHVDKKYDDEPTLKSILFGENGISFVN